MNWLDLMLGSPDPPLGFKKLQSPNAGVVKFQHDHPGLKAVQLSLDAGPEGTMVPNMVDYGNRLSLTVGFYFLEGLFPQLESVSPSVIASGQALGSKFEHRLRTGLSLLVSENNLPFIVSSKGPEGAGGAPSFQLTAYWPYMTPPPAASEESEALDVYKRLGRGHLIQPDVLIWQKRDVPFSNIIDNQVMTTHYPVPTLFACISGKATIRSDRSQSSRYEGTTVSRWRRARPPHIVVVTAEPHPSRLGSLAWGLGDLDCVYHVNLPALYSAVLQAEAEVGTSKARQEGVSSAELAQLINYARLRDLSQLFEDLFGDVVSQSS